ncbi:MAG TPA: FAD-dependent oxidoreductase [Pyrinomonadaceae bacterium]|nr:FAD-dependent oxidoreductase [Pyrinomonadaceae bacterium]
MADENIDLAIVGGGVSGVYSAWRLKRADPARSVVVFEGSGHVGGRLLSVRPPDIENMVAELGGMRILPAVQPLIAKLIQVLNKELPREKEIELYDFPVDEPQNIAYLRGVYLRLSDFTLNPQKVPYHLSFLERGGTAGTIILNAIEQIVPGITQPGLTEEQRREMARDCEFAGRKLYEQGFWNVLLRVISPEAYLLGVDAGGYQSTLTNWNAADAIPWYLSDFGVNPEYKGFKQGFQQVPLALAELFRAEGGDIRLDSQLVGFDWRDGRFELRFKGGGTVSAGALVLAMPRRSLDLLAPNSPPLQPAEIQALIASVTPRPLFKLFTTYTSPWWRAAGLTNQQGKYVAVEAGRTVTDLPVRQTYYWPTDEGKPATGGPSMLMASYDDGTNIGFWDGLRPRRRQAWREGREVSQPDEPFVDEDCQNRPDLEWCKYQAPQKMVDEVARQLGIIHGLSYTPDVRNAAFRDWGDDPFGGGWNSWNIGVESWNVKRQIVQPDGSRPLYVCGEAYSDAQGWVEGALQTADMVLEKFGLQPL